MWPRDRPIWCSLRRRVRARRQSGSASATQRAGSAAQPRTSFGNLDRGSWGVVVRCRIGVCRRSKAICGQWPTIPGRLSPNPRSPRGLAPVASEVWDQIVPELMRLRMVGRLDGAGGRVVLHQLRAVAGASGRAPVCVADVDGRACGSWPRFGGGCPVAGGGSGERPGRNGRGLRSRLLGRCDGPVTGLPRPRRLPAVPPRPCRPADGGDWRVAGWVLEPHVVEPAVAFGGNGSVELPVPRPTPVAGGEDGLLVVGTQLLSEDPELKHVLAGISGQ